MSDIAWRKRMYKKVHFKLTLLFSSITSAIILTMSLCYLYVANQNLQTYNYLSFQNDINTLLTNLEEPNVISQKWIVQMEAANTYFIYIYDKDVAFLSNILPSKQKHAVAADEARMYYNSSTRRAAVSSENKANRIEKFHSDHTNESYYVFLASPKRGNGNLQIVILSPLHPLEEQIQLQRIIFACIDVLAIMFLTLFSYYYTKYLLKPIEENQKKQSRFVASASHELRTPLAVILSSISAMRKSSSERNIDFMQIIESEGYRMSALVNDMLTLANTDSKNMQLHLEKVELDTLLLNSYESFQHLADEQQISLLIALPEEPLPLCHCDKLRIEQVLSILLHNAISYTEAYGTISLCLTYFSSSNYDKFTISVIDTGIGISDTDKSYIFERFYRCDKSHNQNTHFGLGLCIAQDIIKAHLSKILVQDTKNGGTTFFFTLSQPKI